MLCGAVLKKTNVMPPVLCCAVIILWTSCMLSLMDGPNWQLNYVFVNIPIEHRLIYVTNIYYL